MVTYRQVGRGMMRTMRAIDRDAKRAQRQRIAYEKSAQKQALLEASADAASRYEQMIEALTGAHRVRFKRRDWQSVANATPPAMPVPESRHEAQAQADLDNYAPGWLARTLGRGSKQRQKLADKVAEARQHDADAYRDRVEAAARRNAEIDFARRLVDKDPDAIGRVMEEQSHLGELPFAVEGVNMLFTEDGRVIALVDGLEVDDMPTQSVTLLQSGKASIKPIPKSRIHELHRDNICAAALRVAVEFLSLVPIDAVEVIMHGDILDASTGHIHEQPLLYVKVAAQALYQVNLERVDASALVDRLGGRFGWTKRDGFWRLNLDSFDIPVESA